MKFVLFITLVASILLFDNRIIFADEGNKSERETTQLAPIMWHADNDNIKSRQALLKKRNAETLILIPISHNGILCQECKSYAKYELKKPIYPPDYPTEAPHVWDGHTFEKCSYCQRIAFQRYEYQSLLDLFHYRIRKSIMPRILSDGELATYRLMDETTIGIANLNYYSINMLNNIKKITKLLSLDFDILAIDKTKRIITIRHREPYRYLLQREEFLETLHANEKNIYYDMQITKLGIAEFNCYNKNDFVIAMRIAKILDKEFKIVHFDEKGFKIIFEHYRLPRGRVYI